MAIKDTLKKQFLFDGLVIGVIIIVVIVAFWITGSRFSGWEIKNGTESLNDEEKIVNEDIYIHDNGKLNLLSSSLVFESDSELSVYLEGNAKLEVNDSSIKSSNNLYTLSLLEEDGKSPSILATGSDILDHYGIFLKNKSTLEAENSVLGRVVMMDDSEASINNSQIYLILDSSKTEKYENLAAGVSKNFKLESREGWSIKLENSEVTGYQVNFGKNDNVFIENSDGVSVLFDISRGDYENFLPLPTPSVLTTGSLDSVDLDFSWENTKFVGYSFVLDESSIKVQKTSIEDILLTGSEFEVVDSCLKCTVCSVLDSSFVLDNIVVDPDVEIYIYGDSDVSVSNSDLTENKIYLYGNSSLTLKNCQYNESNIKNMGDGNVKII